MNYNSTVSEQAYEAYDNYIEDFVNEMVSDKSPYQLPSSKYIKADKIRRKDLSYETGGYVSKSKQIEYSVVAAMEYRKMVNEYRGRLGFGEVD